MSWKNIYAPQNSFQNLVDAGYLLRLFIKPVMNTLKAGTFPEHKAFQGYVD